MSKRSQGSRPAWLGATVNYRGAPLALRVSPRADSPARRRSFPYLVVLTHHLAKVRSNGLPDPGYNDTLAEFDATIISTLGRRGRGVSVLIETLAGRRNYYAYTRSRVVGAKAFDDIRAQHPEQKLVFRGRTDPRWSVLERYRKEFSW